MRLTPEILAGMQQHALEQQRLLGQRAPWHVGDVAWGLRQHEGREPEWTFRLWRESGDRVVAWSWLKADRGLLDYDLHPEHRHLLDEILDEPNAKEAVAFEDDEQTRAVLARHGFTKPGHAIHFNHRDVPDGSAAVPRRRDHGRAGGPVDRDVGSRPRGDRRPLPGCSSAVVASPHICGRRDGTVLRLDPQRARVWDLAGTLPA